MDQMIAPTARRAIAGTLWQGRFHVFGGLGALHGGTAPDDVGADFWAYDDGWGRLPDGPPGSRYPALCDGGDGKLYLFGGCGAAKNGSKLFYDDLWIYDGAHWSQHMGTGQRPHPRYSSGMCSYQGALWVFFGAHQSGAPERQNTYFNDIWRFDLGTQAWSKVDVEGPQPCPRYACAWALIGGVLYVFGGHDGEKNLGDFWAFNLEDQTWRELESTGPGRHYCASLLHVGDDLVLCGGRLLFEDDWCESVWRYELASGQWCEDVPVQHGVALPRAKHAFASDGTCGYMFGGETPRGLSNALWSLDDQGVWTELSPDMAADD